MKQTRIKELIVAARYYRGAGLYASAVVFVVNSEGDVISYFIAPFEVTVRDRDVGNAICNKISTAGLLGDQNMRDVCVHFWVTNIERKYELNWKPQSLRFYRVIR